MCSERNTLTGPGVSRREAGEQLVAIGAIAILTGGIALDLPIDESEDDDRTKDGTTIGGYGSLEIKSEQEVGT